MPGERERVKGPRILVVDDEPDVLAVLVDVFEAAGYSPWSTADSREAVRLLEMADFDVVVSNVLMPHLNGLQLLKLVKRRSPDIQVVLVTGHFTQELALEALNGGAAGIIRKPFGNEQLLAAVSEAIGRRRPPTETGQVRPPLY